MDSRSWRGSTPSTIRRAEAGFRERQDERSSILGQPVAAAFSQCGPRAYAGSAGGTSAGGPRHRVGERAGWYAETADTQGRCPRGRDVPQGLVP
jgi:hypothetical protein